MKEKDDSRSLFEPVNIQIDQNPDLGNSMAKITLMGIGDGCNMIDNYCSKNQYKTIISMKTRQPNGTFLD